MTAILQSLQATGQSKLIKTMKNILFLSFSLGLICLIAGSTLKLAEDLTKEAREQALTAERFAAMSAVFPEAQFDASVEPIDLSTEAGDFTFYPAWRQGELEGFAGFGASDQGYGGRLRVLVGIELATGGIRKVMVVEHGETPGLGTRATERQSRKSLRDLFSRESEGEEGRSEPPPNPFLDQFDGRGLPDDGIFQIVKGEDARQDRQRDVVAVSGATISSQAVADAVGRVLRTYRAHERELLESAGAMTTP